MERKRSNANRFINKTNLCSRISIYFILSLIFSSTTTGTTNACLDASKCPMFAKGDTNHQKYERRIEHGLVYFEGKTKVSLDWARRFLGGPGSSPPQCTSKCGKCTPCRPVHVTVPPGTPVTAEYYPEAWRCKCGNKLSMP
ncbi:hypothetical protein AAZX31_11G186500 [Glycine max]|uniref:Epidermal patterning factor-like protein n=2 Tax=Glycine subgen. Soja TaxID=1462606 RepID=K7KPR4_SOYBN|nr:polygalacturonase [Glycine max]XP_028187347.1 polygalacturonase-like [Glycine soja]KAG4974649.1 hypothetical protein JHK87_031470 [Glycine soja]KAH1159674.1 hypothetical protein GYH30_031409 [Glycine max]KAH1225672.1 EPIDERMAL PATTERNING FACTOR-like protein 6 [Glycine max]KHN04245.1 EPIDERMAL PATTERNING FACTOR-like protein 6 [Glycine soja]KRH30124.1 hypothetical protein GLYMA_11G160600v4 [Glycine max]|eukprot:XP_006579997.1 polygalacturonase [Glycine max]